MEEITVNGKISDSNVLVKDSKVYTKEEIITILDEIRHLMMCEIYMKGVNMTDEYQGCWVRFRDIEKVVNKYFDEVLEDGKNKTIC